MTRKEHLKQEMAENIQECSRFEKQAAKEGRYADALKLQGMIDAYKKVVWKIDRILKDESGSVSKNEDEKKVYMCTGCQQVPVDVDNGYDTCQSCVEKI